MEQTKVVSLMEQRAKEFPLFSRTASLKLSTKDEEETLGELRHLRSILKTLSEELREARGVVTQKERQFGLLANYKNLLERTIVLPRLVTVERKKSKESELLEKLEALTPEQLRRLEDIEL